MVEINPSIKYQKLSFGAYDISNSAQMPAVPADISNDPYSEQHGDKFKNPRKLLPSLKTDKQNLMPEYDYYMNSGSTTPQDSSPSRAKRTSTTKTVLIAAGVIAGGIFIYKKGNTLLKFFKKKKPTEEPSRTGLKTDPKRISTEKFKEYYQDAIKKANVDENLDSIRLDNLQVVMKGPKYNAAEKRAQLKNVIELGEIYTLKDYQPRIRLILPESINDKTDYLIEMLSKNRIDEVDDKLIDKIEGFKFWNTKRQWSDNHDVLFDAQVRHGVNSRQAEDIASKWKRNIVDRFRGYF